MSVGMSSCKTCGGKGVIVLSAGPPPKVESCKCVYFRSVLLNVERAWSGLSKARKLKKGSISPLKEYANSNLWITAPEAWLRSQLRWIGIRKAPSWNFQVKTDSDLMTAWLANIGLQGMEILDPDAMAVSTKKITIVDLVEPPDLLVLRLGVKAARNSAMNEVLLEALAHRTHIGKPTWVWDQPLNPLNQNHLCWSPAVEEFLSSWKHIAPKKQKQRHQQLPQASSFIRSGATKAIEETETLEARIAREEQEREQKKRKEKFYAKKRKK